MIWLKLGIIMLLICLCHKILNKLNIMNHFGCFVMVQKAYWGQTGWFSKTRTRATILPLPWLPLKLIPLACPRLNNIPTYPGQVYCNSNVSLMPKTPINRPISIILQNTINAIVPECLPKRFRYSCFRYLVNKKLRRSPFFRYCSEFRYLGFRYSSRHLYYFAIFLDVRRFYSWGGAADHCFIKSTLLPSPVRKAPPWKQLVLNQQISEGKTNVIF